MHLETSNAYLRSCYKLVLLLLLSILLSLSSCIGEASQYEDSHLNDASSAAGSEAPSGGPAGAPGELPVPPPAAPTERPPVQFNIHDWTSKLSKDIRLVNNKMNCLRKIEQFYDDKAQFYVADANKIRDSIIQEIDALLAQHRAAVTSIVNEAERLVLAHRFNKSLKFQYTDVHRLRGELDPPSPAELAWLASVAEAAANSSAAAAAGAAALSGTNQFTSINGGTPVAGLPEWQTPFKTISMQLNRNFGDIPVNTSMSAIHLPLPLYAGLPNIMNGIAWTEKLDQVFIKNLLEYNHVHHQYYGSHLGFMRTFPAHKWRIPRADPDLFDARVRPWYVAGASFPKDVVILVDSSGSMTGIRREIAKGVVYEILDTLTSNDNFAVLRFSETVTPMGFPGRCKLKKPKLALDCLTNAMDETRECHLARAQYEASQQYLLDHPNYASSLNASYITDQQYNDSIRNVTMDLADAFLLPATSRNIRYLKTNFTMPTVGIANFTRALMAAFELLQAYNRSSELSSHCNQAIMLITDGSLRDHQEVFNRYNYPNSPIRVFSYVIGREVGDVRPTQAMACNNRGFYARVINLGEARDQVQKYLAVLARPMVLSKVHAVTWTHAYGDETYQVLTDWVLETKRRERARIMLNEMAATERANESEVYIWSTGISEYDEVNVVDLFKNRLICEDENQDELKLNQSLAEELDPLGYGELSCHWSLRKADLLISVVKPVYYNNLTTLFFERVLHKNIWSEQETHVRNAQMLGVAAVDLRLSDMLKAGPSHLLGPNSYLVLMGHNGFVMHHPDLRALLEDPYDKQSKLLKPFFSSVDLTHIEQAHTRHESARKAVEELKLLRLREAAVRRSQGQEAVPLKRAVDCRRRPMVGSQTFYYGPIKDTPYSLMLAVPTSYGLNRAKGRLELNQQSMSYLEPSQTELWTVHPEFRYCVAPKGRGDPQPPGSDSVALILEVLREAREKGSSYSSETLFERIPNLDLPDRIYKRGKTVCDKELFESFLFDAAATREHADSYCGLETDCDKTSGWGRKECVQTPWEMRYKMAGIYGLELSFIATRSGLTRVRVSDLSSRIKKLAEVFMERHARASDEPWYSRVVDLNMRVSEDWTVVSVPFNVHQRLVAKFRQRITQLQPQGVNSTKSRCDEEEDEAEADTEEGEPDSSTRAGAADANGTVASTETSEEPSKLLNDQSVDEFTTASYTTPTIPAVDYGNYSTFEILDLISNSSVHVSTMQTIIANRNKNRVPVGVSGLLFDYSTFARRFLNSTSLKITRLDGFSTGASQNPEVQVELCPGGECPTSCGYRNDTIDCILVDNNGYVVVAEDLVHIGRPLADYDDRLMQTLVEKRFFYPIQLTDYQAICVRNESTNSPSSTQPNGTPSPASSNSGPPRSLSPLHTWGPTAGSLASNFAGIAVWLWAQLIGLLTLEPVLSDFGLIQHEARTLVEAQSSLSMLPNKTLLRACEKPVLLYETRPPRDTPQQADENSGRPDYYQTRCGCPGWFVAEYVPRTNLIMLIVNTSTPCRRCEIPAGQPNNLVPGPVSPTVVAADVQQNREEQVCSMLEREQLLYVRRPETCITSHPEESQIKLCGRSSSLRPAWWLLVFVCLLAHLMGHLFTPPIKEHNCIY